AARASFRQITCLAAVLLLVVAGCSTPGNWLYSDRSVDLWQTNPSAESVPVPPNPVVIHPQAATNQVTIRQVAAYSCPNCVPPAPAAGQENGKEPPAPPKPHTFPQALRAYFCCLHNPPPPEKETNGKKEETGEK